MKSTEYKDQAEWSYSGISCQPEPYSQPHCKQTAARKQTIVQNPIMPSNNMVLKLLWV